MRKLFLVLICIISFSNCKDRNGEISKTAVEFENEDVVDCQLLVKQLDVEQAFEKEKLEFSIVETIEYEINGNGIMKISIEKIDSWYEYREEHCRFDWNDPGDFHRIKIEYKDTCYTFFNSGGWIKPKLSDFYYVPDFSKNNKIHSDYLVLTQNNNDLLLFAFGYAYASEPGLLSIINLSSPKPELIFNNNYMLSGYRENNPKIMVVEFLEDGNGRQDTLLLINHRLQKIS